MMRILLVDDHDLFRAGLVGLLEAQVGFKVVGEAGSVREAISMTRELQPDVVLMDFGLPDGTGLEATQAILADQPDTNIVFLTVHEEDDRLFAAIRHGAKGYLLKNVPIAKLVAFLEGLSRGEAAISRAMTSRVFDQLARLGTGPIPSQTIVDTLTARELEVLRELTTGATNSEIADRLVISENTVKNHVRNILAKLGFKNRRQAADFARTQGLSR